MPSDFVPAAFAVPAGLSGPGFILRPLTADDNPRDYAAWTSSVDHIHATPGFAGRPWPCEMSLEENLGDLQGHAEDFAQRRGFTYTVIEGDDVIGCVYVYPSEAPGFDADVRSWVRADRASLDVALFQAVSQWLADAWPFSSIDYAAR